jgi:N-acetylmuramic acid 6-phosphate etherase
MSAGEQLSKLTTEKPNRASANLDEMNSLEIARLMNSEDAKVASAVERALPQIARAIDVIATALEGDGRLIYVGTGTSGRIGALDASECSPTFKTDPRMVQYVIAGGVRALGTAVEASEDSTAAGRRDIARKRPTRKDVVIGLAASGRTPYTVAAVEYARSKGARTVAVVCNPNSRLERAADFGIVADVGPEVLTGSTRLKAGTAQKMICNMLTTGAMARLGYIYGNLMVNLRLKNRKLLERGIRMVETLAEVDRETATRTLKKAGTVPLALVMLKAGLAKAEAQRRLRRTNGRQRKAIGELSS